MAVEGDGGAQGPEQGFLGGFDRCGEGGLVEGEQKTTERSCRHDPDNPPTQTDAGRLVNDRNAD